MLALCPNSWRFPCLERPNRGLHSAPSRPRQGLTGLASRKAAEAWPARCGGDVRALQTSVGQPFGKPGWSSLESLAAASKNTLSPQKLALAASYAVAVAGQGFDFPFQFHDREQGQHLSGRLLGAQGQLVQKQAGL